MNSSIQVVKINHIKDRLRDAFCELDRGVEPKNPDALRVTIDQLALFAGPHTDNQIPPAFQARGRIETKKQLEALAKAAENMAAKIQALNSPAIDALSDEGWLRESWSEDCLALAVRARRANIDTLPNYAQAGRRAGNRNTFVTHLIMRGFEERTGTDPGQTVGRGTTAARGIRPLICKVFDILGLEADARSAQRAVELTRSKRPPALTEDVDARPALNPLSRGTKKPKRS